jgi:hypothetical protein
MKTVERALARALTLKIEAAVNAILKEHGMEPGRVNTTYGDFYKFAIQATPVGAPKPEENDWAMLAPLYGLPADGLGKQIRLGGRGFTIAGFNARARKSPVMLTEDNSGRSFKAPVEGVKRALALNGS